MQDFEQDLLAVQGNARERAPHEGASVGDDLDLDADRLCVAGHAVAARLDTARCCYAPSGA